MNVLLLAAFALCLLGWVWAAQTLALRSEGNRKIWVRPLGHGCDSPRVRGAVKLALSSGTIAVIFLYPSAIGENPLQYHGAKFAMIHLDLSVQALLLSCGLLAVVLVGSVLAGWVKLERRHSTGRIAYKVLKAFLIPLPLTLMEEPLFRGLLLEQLTEALPSNAFGASVALTGSSSVFVATHLLRPQKHALLATIGLFYVGLVLGLFYVVSGHNYWLPIAFHAGGVLFIQATRPLTRYEGPAWLVGRSTYPIAGLLGALAIAVAAGIVLVQIPA